MAVNVPLQTLFANTRAGTVYQTTSAGGIAAVSANTTRTAHWRGGKPHALFEPSRTNELLYSGDMDGTGWTGFRTTYTTGDAAPLSGEFFLTGTANATNANGSAVAQKTISGKTAGTYTMSVFVKAGPSDPGWLLIRPTDNSDFTNRAEAWFDISGAATGTVSSPGTNFTSATSKLENLGGGIYRASITFTTDATLDIACRFYVVDGNASLTTTLGKDIQLWGAQFETGAFPTSYVPTSGSAVARAADNATCSVSTFPIDQNGGSIRVIGRADYTVGGSSSPRVFQVDDGTDNNRVLLTISETAGTISLFVIVGGAVQASEAMAYTSGAEFNALLCFGVDNVFLSLGGSDSTPDTSASFPTGLLTTWRWARDAAGNNGAAVLINRIASHSHEFSTTAANTITG